MANNFLKIRNGITLSPQTGSVVSSEGDIAYNDTTKKVEVNDGSTTDSVVEEIKAATLANKILTFLQTEVTTDNTTTGTAATLTSGDITVGVVRLTNSSLVSVSGIPAGLAGQQIVVENQTGGSVTINNNDSGAVAGNKIFTGSGGPVSMLSNATFTFTYDAVAAYWMLTGGSGSGSGGSGAGKNYLTAYTASTSSNVPNTGNGNFELSSTAGWSLANSALSGVNPTSVATAGNPFSSSSGGTPASGNLSFSIVSSGQLAGSYSGSLVSSAASTSGDMLVSNAFFIDIEDQAKVLGFSFAYKAVSGTFDFSGTSTNSFAVWIYDVSNGAWIQPAGVYDLVQGSGVGLCKGTFQSSANSTQYQIVVININATSGAYTLYVDDFFVGPQIAVNAPAISDWTSYDLVIGSTVTPPTPGTTLVNNAVWRRIGDSMEIQFQYVQTSAGSAGSGSYIFPLPAGYSIDLTKLNNNAAAAVGPCYVSGVSGNGTGFAWVANANGLFLDSTSSNQANGGLFTVTNTYNGLDNGVNYSFTALVPIVGWSSNSVASSDTDTRVVAAVIDTSSSAISGNIIYTNVEKDTHGAYNPSTGIYTVPVSGFYDVDLAISAYPWTAGAGNYINTQLFKNGSSIREFISAPDLQNGQLGTGALSTLVYCNAGDTLNLVASTGGFSGASADGSANNNFISFARRSGPAVITATETIGMTYATSVNSAVTSGTPIYTDVKIFDTHDAFTPSSGIYVIPVSGKYRISAIYQCQTVGVSGYVVQNGVGISYFGTMSASGEINGGSIVIPCNAGDQISVNSNSTATFQGHDGLAYITSVSIMREGN